MDFDGISRIILSETEYDDDVVMDQAGERKNEDTERDEDTTVTATGNQRPPDFDVDEVMKDIEELMSQYK